MICTNSRMNEDNLIPLNKRAKSEQRRIQVMGGKARGKQRRDKRDFREIFTALLAMPMTDKNGEVAVSPITGKPMSIREQITLTTLYGAIKGDSKKLRIILDVLGEGAQIVKNEFSGAVAVDNKRIDLSQLTEEQRNAILSIGEEILARKEVE